MKDRCITGNIDIVSSSSIQRAACVPPIAFHPPSHSSHCADALTPAIFAPTYMMSLAGCPAEEDWVDWASNQKTKTMMVIWYSARAIVAKGV